jgi:DEAD/DEAH box helicase domain-containing protein
MEPLLELINQWETKPSISQNIVAWETLHGKDAVLDPLPSSLHPALKYGLQQSNIKSLYRHQSISYNLAVGGNNIAVITGTASGKTLCYNIPVVNDILNNQHSKALYLFPTKSLANDQLSGLKKLLSVINTWSIDNNSNHKIIAETYDGDTPNNTRTKIRNKAQIIFSNPDMLHASILPHHTRWAHFFSDLHYVIIDEMHVYRGVFGSHVANIIRRLNRIVSFYSSKLQFILTSATIANPTDLAQRLTEESIEVVDEDGSSNGSKHFLIYNPPIIDTDLGLRNSVMEESIRLIKELISHNIQTIVFGKTRRFVESLLIQLRQNGPINESLSFIKINEKIRAYRSGYLPKHRRKIEASLRNGDVRVVVATSALELGIDIGHIDASVIVGFPGTISGARQQAGRAGRTVSMSIAIMIASNSPIDQYLAKNPDYFFNQKPEIAHIDPNNLLIALAHIQCAVYELPFGIGESFGTLGRDLTKGYLNILVTSGKILSSADKYYWITDEYPAATISLRNASPHRFTLLDISGVYPITLGEIDAESAPWMVHPQAIYLHEGATFLVSDFDIERKLVSLQSANVDYYTRPQRKTDVHLDEKLLEERVFGGVKLFGRITVTEQVTGFQRLQWGTAEILGQYELDLPASKLKTDGYFICLNKNSVDILRKQGLWSNDRINYGPNWEHQRYRARERDGFRCQICGEYESDSAHHVHHIKPFRTYSNYSGANKLENLVTLCSTCHSRVENSVRIKSGLSGLCYILNQIAPLFLMCDPGDLGAHFDPRPQINDTNPIILLYERIPGGIGFSQTMFKKHEDLLNLAYDITCKCECKDGCPSCVGPGGEIGAGSKNETLAILQLLIKINLATDS